jgi:hypothetical protein
MSTGFEWAVVKEDPNGTEKQKDDLDALITAPSRTTFDKKDWDTSLNERLQMLPDLLQKYDLHGLSDDQVFKIMEPGKGLLESKVSHFYQLKERFPGDEKWLFLEVHYSNRKVDKYRVGECQPHRLGDHFSHWYSESISPQTKTGFTLRAFRDKRFYTDSELDTVFRQQPVQLFTPKNWLDNFNSRLFLIPSMVHRYKLFGKNRQQIQQLLGNPEDMNDIIEDRPDLKSDVDWFRVQYPFGCFLDNSPMIFLELAYKNGRVLNYRLVSFGTKAEWTGVFGKWH